MNIKLHTAFFGAIIIFFPIAQAIAESAGIGPPIAHPKSPAPEPPPKISFSMVGTWEDSETHAKVIFNTDNGSMVFGLYDSGIKHFFDGEYTDSARKKINLTITRNNTEMNCKIKVAGLIEVIDNNKVRFQQAPWRQECGLTKEILEDQRIKFGHREWAYWDRVN